MKNKILIFILLLSLVFSSTGFVFALEEPEKPVLTDSTNNESIKEYNTKVEDYNKKVDEYNATAKAKHDAAVADVKQKNEAGMKAQEESQKAHDDAVAAEAQANAEEKARVDEANQAINERNAAAQAAYEEEKTAVETHNTFVDNVDNKIEADSSESRGFTNNTTHDAPTDWSGSTNENTLKTIQIEKSDNPSREKIKVINLHVFLDETLPYSPDCYQTSIGDDSFELDEEMTNRAVLTEWETAEIDYDDTVTLFSEATNFAGNIVWLNGKRQWFGTDPKPYFFRAIEGYTQGYWMPGGSMLATTATVQDYGYAPGGETYTVQYAEETAYSSYLYNGQPMIEEITVRTTDKQEPKNIFAIFTYLFTRLAPEPEKKEAPNPPELEELEEFVPIVMEIPEVIYWTLIDDPEEPTYLSHLNFVDLLPTKNPTKNKFTIQTIASTTDIIIASDAPKAAPKTKATPIIDTPAPKTAPQGSWALINLIATILSCICAVILLFVRKDKENDEPTKEEKRDMRGMIGTKLASVLVGIISIIIFIFTEDMTLPMVYTDKWTFLMILLLIVEIINIFIIRQQSKGEEDDD